MPARAARRLLVVDRLINNDRALIADENRRKTLAKLIAPARPRAPGG
jgi:hypothetical protein